MIFFLPCWQDKQIPTYTGFPLQALPNKPLHHHSLSYMWTHNHAHTPHPPAAVFSEDPQSGGSIIRTILITCSHFPLATQANVEQ